MSGSPAEGAAAPLDPAAGVAANTRRRRAESEAAANAKDAEIAELREQLKKARAETAAGAQAAAAARAAADRAKKKNKKKKSRESSVGNWLQYDSESDSSSSSDDDNKTTVELVNKQISAAGRSSDQKRWTAREFAKPGVLLFKILYNPKKHRHFCLWTNTADITTRRVPPLHQRLMMVMTHAAYIHQYNALRTYLNDDKAEPVNDPVKEFGDPLRELVCQYMILGSEGSTGGIPFSVYLGMSYMTYERAASTAKEHFLKYKGRMNMVTMHMQLSKFGWDLNLKDEDNTGLSIENEDQYQDLVTAAHAAQVAQRNQLMSQLQQLQALHGQTPSQNQQQQMANNGQVFRGNKQVQPQIGPKVESLSMAWGRAVDVEGRCYKCGKLGHELVHCTNPPHPLFREHDTFYFIKVLSYGNIPLP